MSPEREAKFPGLAKADYEVTSDDVATYNCIAYAADDIQRKWQWLNYLRPGYYWPPNAKGGDELAALISAFETLGYEVCHSPAREDGFGKVALYADENGEWQHAAKQLENGQWSSKLGDWEDIRHATLDSVQSADYGKAVCLMKRPKGNAIKAASAPSP